MSQGESFTRDLAVLVPDKAFLTVVRILCLRDQSLGIHPIAADFFAHPHHDHGCPNESANFLREFLPTHARAIVLFDHHGSGHEGTPAPELEAVVRESLARAGWQGRAEVVVLEPELESWVWSDSPEVEQCLGWRSRQVRLREWLEQAGLWPRGDPKPPDPKSAMLRVLGETREGPVRSVFAELARSVGLRRCTDRAFLRFREILQDWFPAS